MTALITQLKTAGQDHEFYPTTQEIIAALVRDMKRRPDSTFDGRRYRSGESMAHLSAFMDIGAGNGKVIDAVREACDSKDRNGLSFDRYYAIEKSPILRGQLSEDIFVIGTDLMEQSLITKPVGVIFCNPPYSVFREWMVKIIRESAAPCIYFVVPRRWQEMQEIKDAIKFRNAKHVVVGSFDFEDAEDRAARAYVHLVRIDLPDNADDAFDRFFEEQFSALKGRPKVDDDEPKQEKRGKFADLVVGASYPAALVSLYMEDMARTQRNYAAVCQIDREILAEFKIDFDAVRNTLKAKLSGLRMVYWKELFSRLDTITDRLTAKRREDLLGTLQKHCHVDFTVDNIHAVVIWVIKNSNAHLDGQLCEVFEEMVSKANIYCYKSNQRVFEFDDWRYRNRQREMPEADRPNHFALEYRLVLTHMGGLRATYTRGQYEPGERMCIFLQDLRTIARNLGFIPLNPMLPGGKERAVSDGRLDRWSRSWNGSGVKELFMCRNSRTGKEEILVEVRAFLNGNAHIRLNPQFALCLNVEYGRLKGWVKSGRHAADEVARTTEEKKEAEQFYGALQPIAASTIPLLAAPPAAPAPSKPFTIDLTQAA